MQSCRCYVARGIRCVQHVTPVLQCNFISLLSPFILPLRRLSEVFDGVYVLSHETVYAQVDNYKSCVGLICAKYSGEISFKNRYTIVICAQIKIWIPTSHACNSNCHNYLTLLN